VRGTSEQIATIFGRRNTYAQPNPCGKDKVILIFDRWRPKNPIDSRYLWLPLEWESGKPVVRWHDQ